MNKVVKLSALVVSIALVSGCSSTTPNVTDQAPPKFTDQQALMAAVNNTCMNPEPDAFQSESAWTQIDFPDAAEGHRWWTYNGYGDYDSAKWGTDASNAWDVSDGPNGLIVKGATILSQGKWDCKSDLILGVTLAPNDDGELILK